MSATRTPQERAKRLLDDNLHMTVATVGASGAPWVSPVFYVPDDEYELYWVSGRSSEHSQNVRRNPIVAIVVYETSPTVDAVYITAEVCELNDPDDVRRAMAIVARREQPERWSIGDGAEVSGAGPWRIYRASPKTIEVRRDGEEGGKAVVWREEADFRGSD